MAVTPYEQRSYPGAAADTTLAAGITAAALSFTVATGDGVHYPDGSGGPFWVVIDYDVSTTEKLHCTSRSGDLFTVDVRGADGTTAQAHSLGAKVRACWTATDAQEANRAASNTVGKVTSKGDLLVGTAANTLARLGVGANNTVHVADSTQATGTKWASSLTGLTFDATSSLGGVTGTQLAADHTSIGTLTGAWTAFTATVTSSSVSGAVNPTISSQDCAYRLNGKTLNVRYDIVFSANGSAGLQYSISLPASLAAKAAAALAGWFTSSAKTAVGVVLAGGTTVIPSDQAGFITSSDVPGRFVFTGAIEVT